VFHAPWELRAHALAGLAMREGIFNMDEFRHSIERMEPRHYLSAGYYERSLTGLATLLVEKGVTTPQELDRLARGAFPISEPIGAGRLNAPDERFAGRPGAREGGLRPATCACRHTSVARSASWSADTDLSFPDANARRRGGRADLRRRFHPRICGRTRRFGLVHVGVIELRSEPEQRRPATKPQ
jgi:hypothetical protein